MKTKPRKTLAAFGRMRGKRADYYFASDDAYFNWLSRMTDDNPDYKQATNE